MQLAGAVMSRGGRPRDVDRPRQPNGRVCPEVEQPSYVPLRRGTAEVLKLLKSEVLGTQLGQMMALGQLTKAQYETGLYVAKVYGTFEGLKGLPRRTARSPVYESSFGSSDVAEELLDAETRKAMRQRVIDAEETWKRLQDAIPDQMRSLIEGLCLNDEAVHSSNFPVVGLCLDFISQKLKSKARAIRQDHHQAGATETLNFNAHLNADKQTPDAARIFPTPEAKSDREMCLAVLLKFCVDVPIEDLRAAYDEIQARRDRAALRRRKAQGR